MFFTFKDFCPLQIMGLATPSLGTLIEPKLHRIKQLFLLSRCLLHPTVITNNEKTIRQESVLTVVALFDMASDCGYSERLWVFYSEVWRAGEGGGKRWQHRGDIQGSYHHCCKPRINKYNPASPRIVILLPWLGVTFALPLTDNVDIVINFLEKIFLQFNVWMIFFLTGGFQILWVGQTEQTRRMYF